MTNRRVPCQRRGGVESTLGKGGYIKTEGKCAENLKLNKDPTKPFKKIIAPPGEEERGGRRDGNMQLLSAQRKIT